MLMQIYGFKIIYFLNLHLNFLLLSKYMQHFKRKFYFTVFHGFLLVFGFKNFAQTSTVNWNVIEGQVPDKMFGLTIWDGTQNGINNDTNYKAAVSDLNLSIVRFHAYEMTQNLNNKSWYNTATQQWRTSVIDGCLQAQNAQNKLISIFNFPQWLSTNGIDVKNMNVSNAQIYADWCANLVQIVNVQLGRNVKYWTVFNELENNYSSNIQDLATIYLACYTKMKLIDPTIKIGAFAVSQPWWNNAAQQSFYYTTRNNLDFIDYHLYGRDFSNVANNFLYNDANYLGYGGVDNVRNLATAAGVPLAVPIWLSESNIVYSYTNDPEGKMATNVGAVWDALLFESAIKAKAISSISLFNDRDGVYGKLSSNNTKRPAYYNLKILSNNFYGTFVNSLSSDSDIKILAVKNNGKYSVMICNRGLVNKTVNLNFTNGPANGSSYTKVELKNAINETNLVWNNATNYTIPSESIVYLLFNLPLANVSTDAENNSISLKNTVIKNHKIVIDSGINVNATICIYNLNGKLIFSENNYNINVGTNAIDISGLQALTGIYLLKIKTFENTFQTFKIVL
jgi:hypothetical protein